MAIGGEFEGLRTEFRHGCDACVWPADGWAAAGEYHEDRGLKMMVVQEVKVPSWMDASTVA